MNQSENIPFRVHFVARLRRIVNLFNEIAHQNEPDKGHLQLIHLLSNRLLYKIDKVLYLLQEFFRLLNV